MEAGVGVKHQGRVDAGVEGEGTQEDIFQVKRK